ncbi:MAG TPA: copper resistance protein CopC, partial [Candidatus Limnocylindrales bacterium]|nr:copper resistance protein CopC [Candidatus Limnocylindrales bacterium]
MTSRIRGARLRVAAVIASFVIFMVPGSTLAHAELVRSIPADGETVTEPVTVVSATYSQDLAANSKLLVKDASGATVATGAVDPGNARRMIARPSSPLENGAYEVQSTSISADDGDIERLEWTFTVAVATSPSATEQPSGSVEPTPICTDQCPGQASPTAPASPSTS